MNDTKPMLVGPLSDATCTSTGSALVEEASDAPEDDVLVEEQALKVRQTAKAATAAATTPATISLFFTE